jgi:predicted nucleic-acid-binding protein
MLSLQNLLKGKSFETDLERQIFMAINVARAAPAQFAQVVRSVKQNNMLAKKA